MTSVIGFTVNFDCFSVPGLKKKILINQSRESKTECENHPLEVDAEYMPVICRNEPD